MDRYYAQDYRSNYYWNNRQGLYRSAQYIRDVSLSLARSKMIGRSNRINTYYDYYERSLRRIYAEAHYKDMPPKFFVAAAREGIDLTNSWLKQQIDHEEAIAKATDLSKRMMFLRASGAFSNDDKIRDQARDAMFRFSHAQNVYASMKEAARDMSKDVTGDSDLECLTRRRCFQERFEAFLDISWSTRPLP